MITTLLYTLTYILIYHFVCYLTDKVYRGYKEERLTLKHKMEVERARERGYALAYQKAHGNGLDIARDNNLFGFYRTLR